MKNLCIILILLQLPCCLMAQQQAKKRGIIIEQIAGLAVYGKALKKGYDITTAGLNTAHSMKNGTFSLHTGYIDSLSTVSKQVRSNPKITSIRELQQRIITVFADEINWQQAQGIMTNMDVNYLKKVRDNLLNDCRDNLDELQQVTGNGQLKMTDAQRLERIDKLYSDMQDKYAFACAYTAKTHKLTQVRKRDKQERERLKKLYGIQ